MRTPRTQIFPYTTLFRSEILIDGHEEIQRNNNRTIQAMGELQKTNNAQLEEMNEEIKRSEEHTSELQSRGHLVCRLLLEKKKTLSRSIAETRKKPVSTGG